MSWETAGDPCRPVDETPQCGWCKRHFRKTWAGMKSVDLLSGHIVERRRIYNLVACRKCTPLLVELVDAFNEQRKRWKGAQETWRAKVLAIEHFEVTDGWGRKGNTLAWLGARGELRRLLVEHGRYGEPRALAMEVA